MPTYSYKCRECADEFTEIKMMSDRAVPTEAPCSKCGGEIYQKITPVKMSYQGKMKTTNSFNDRLKDIKRTLPPSAQSSIGDNIR